MREQTRVGFIADLAAIWLAGCFGTYVRIVASSWGDGRGFDEWPWTTLAVNLVGCAMLGVLVAWYSQLSQPVQQRWRRMRLAVATGFLGSLTTYSAFVLESTLLARTSLLSALGYVTTSLICGIGILVATARLVMRLADGRSK